MMYGYMHVYRLDNVNPILEDLWKEIIENRVDTREFGL